MFYIEKYNADTSLLIKAIVDDNNIVIAGRQRSVSASQRATEQFNRGGYEKRLVVTDELLKELRKG